MQAPYPLNPDQQNEQDYLYALMNLPSSHNAATVPSEYGYMPGWTAASDLAKWSNQLSPGIADQAIAWLKSHQEAVFLGAGGLFVLALVVGGRRRR